MDLRRLQVFAKVYQCRSFSRAAEEILLSQPTVSGHIKSLEEELEVQLFDRLGRDILPTRAAEVLYGHAERILAMVEEAQSAMDAFMGRLRGNLTLGGSTIPGQYVLPSLLGRFHLLHPEVKVVLSIASSGEISERVLGGELEAAVVGAEPDDERLAATALMDDEVIPVAWPGHPLAQGEVSPAQLIECPIVLRELSSGTRTFVAKVLAREGLSLGDLDVAAQMGSTMAVIQAVRAQVGVGFVSKRAVVEDLEAGRLVQLEVMGMDFRRQFYLITRKNRTHSPAAQAFLALCMAELDDRHQPES